MASLPTPAAVRTARRLRRSVVRSVASAAERVARAQRRLRPEDVQRKGVGDFVTAIDLRTERHLRRELRALLPEAGFLGEESSPDAVEQDWVWVVDPIDGTSNFSRGLPCFAVSVALLHLGAPVLAAVHCAPYGDLLAAVSGDGAWRKARRVIAPPGRFDDGTILGCQWYRGQQDLRFLAALQRDGARIRTFGSTVTQVADVVMGRLDGNVQQQGRLWDIAAIGLIAIESGLRFTDWRGRPVFPCRDLAIGHTATIAASPGVHRRLQRVLAGLS